MITSFVKTMCDFSFRGRATRSEFLSFMITSTIISLMFVTAIMTLAVNILGLKINITTGDLYIPYKMRNLGVFPFVIMTTTIVIYAAFNIWAAIAGGLLAIRRLHDINCSGVGYWVWVASIIFFSTAQTSILTGFLCYFILGGIILLAVKTSFPYENKYGKVKSEELIQQT